MRILFITLCILLIGLQYRLWFGKNSVHDYLKLKQQVEAQRTLNGQLQERNQVLYAEIEALRVDLDAVEERARNELGLVKQDETFFRIISKKSK